MKPGDKSISVSGEIHRQTKVVSAARGEPMQKFAERALRKALEEEKQRQTAGGQQ